LNTALVHAVWEDRDAKKEAAGMLFMVIERYKNQDGKTIYSRFRGSWIDPSFSRCFMVMECDELGLLRQWVLQWNDLVEFEIVPVSPSKEVAEGVYAVLDAPASSAIGFRGDS
jgi:hypothetical protein